MAESYENFIIPVYIINRKSRIDRLEHIKTQFVDKPEFEVHIVEACEHFFGRVGLWNSINKIIYELMEGNDDVIIICEDDHIFTNHYTKDYLFKNIVEAAEQGVELLSGGIGGFYNAVPISENRFWIDNYWCNQFLVLYRSIFQKILDVDFTDTDTADGVLSEISSHKMVLFPFISIQQDFGYSDVTRTNNEFKGRITAHFQEAEYKLNLYYAANRKYLLNPDRGASSINYET